MAVFACGCLNVKIHAKEYKAVDDGKAASSNIFQNMFSQLI